MSATPAACLLCVLLACTCLQGDAAASAAWGLVQGLQRDLSNMAASLCGSHGGSSSRQLAMCLAGIKMAEQAVLHYTAQASMQLAQLAAALAAEVQRLGQLLVQLLDVATVKQRAGAVVIAAVKGLGCCCLQRQQLLPTLLPSLLALAEQVRMCQYVCMCDCAVVGRVTVGVWRVQGAVAPAAAGAGSSWCVVWGVGAAAAVWFPRMLA